MNRNDTSELWAITDHDGNVLYSRGGSSTGRKLLIYETEAQAKKVLNNQWIKQVIPDQTKVDVRLIYNAKRKTQE